MKDREETMKAAEGREVRRRIREAARELRKDQDWRKNNITTFLDQVHVFRSDLFHPPWEWGS